MSYDLNCPVPKGQRPIEEFIEISNSWFFKWPLSNKTILFRNLIIVWLTSTLIFIFIGTGSIHLSKNISDLIITSLTSSLIIPTLIIFRLLIGWSYIHNRLISAIIEYEETDWHDGQKWRKPTCKECELRAAREKYHKCPPTDRRHRNAVNPCNSIEYRLSLIHI